MNNPPELRTGTAFAAQIVNYLLEETRELKLSEEYVEHNIVSGNEITITDNKSSRSAIALAICPDGKLLVQETDGTQSKLAFWRNLNKNTADKIDLSAVKLSEILCSRYLTFIGNATLFCRIIVWLSSNEWLN